MKRLILIPALLVLIGVTLLPSAAAASTRAPAAASAPACSWGDLKVTASWHVANKGIPGGGAVVGTISFRKLSAGSCVLQGWARVRVHDAQGHQLPLQLRKLAGRINPAPAVILSAAGIARVTQVSIEWLNWCQDPMARPLSLAVRLPGRAVFYRVQIKPGGQAMASCINPTVGSVIDVMPFGA